MNENVNVCITPKGDKPILHFSQFDNGRIFTVTVLADDGETAAVLTDLDIEFRLRKTDSHVVTVAPESVTDNIITFKTTEQMCACCGHNIASVVLMDDDSNIISTLDILVDIQRDILSGGLTSESDIRNLTTQIEQIVPEVIGDDYYTKTEVDEIIADIPTFDPSNYYDKSDVDSLLADKANADDVYTKSDVYNKTETDNLLADKADASDVYTKSETDDLLADKADIDDVMVKVTRHGIIGDMSSFTFTNNCIAPMDGIVCDITYTQSGTGTPSPSNPRHINGYSECTITVADSDDTPVNTVTVPFGQTLYSGECSITSGTATNNYGLVDLSTLSWVYASGAKRWEALKTDMKSYGSRSDDVVFEKYETDTTASAGSENKGFIAATVIYVASTDSVNQPSGTCLYPLATPANITMTPATTDTINGTNKVSSSTGNMKSLTYFSDVNSDLVDLIRACMI